MSIMKSLTFAALPKVTRDPVQVRRQKLITRLEEQKALIADPAFVRTVQRSKKQDGERVIVTRQTRIRPWWRSDEKGQVVLFARYGWKLLEFEKGKPGVLVGSKEKLPAVIDTLIEAVRAGELDRPLDQMKSARPIAKRKAG